MPQETEEYFGSLGETPKGIKELQDWIDGTGEHQDRTQGQKKAARTIMEEHEKQIQKMLEEEDIKVTKKEAREELIKELRWQQFMKTIRAETYDSIRYYRRILWDSDNKRAGGVSG